MCRIDLNDSGEGGEGGFVPMWIYTQTIGLSGSASLAKMRKQMRLEMEERQTAAEGRTLPEAGSDKAMSRYSAALLTLPSFLLGYYFVRRQR